MWIWIACLVVLVVCFIIALKMLINSYDSMSSEKKFNLFQSFSPSDISNHMETIRALKSKLKSLEDKTEYYDSQIEKINRKLRLVKVPEPAMTIATPVTPFMHIQDEEEDWKELYYEENAKKEKLENELDMAQQDIEYLQNELKQKTEIATQYEAAQHANEDAQRTMEELKAAVSRLNEQLSASHQIEQEQQIRMNELTEKNAHLEAEAVRLRERAEALETLHHKSEEDKNLVQSFAKEKEELQARLAESVEQKDGLIQSLQQEINEKHQLQEMIRNVQDENQNLKQQLAGMNDANSELNDARTKVQQLENRLRSFFDEHSDLQKKLEQSTIAYEELSHRLQNEIQQKEQLEEAVNQVNILRNENEGYKRQIAEMAALQSDIEGKLLHLKELEDKVTHFEQEKTRMITDLETILSQTRTQSS